MLRPYTFYRSLIGEEASVTATVFDMNALALKMFFNSLNCHASKLLEKVDLIIFQLSNYLGRSKRSETIQ